MKKAPAPPHTLMQWFEFCWLYVTNTAFRKAPNKRKAYFEHCLVKGFHLWFW